MKVIASSRTFYLDFRRVQARKSIITVCSISEKLGEDFPSLGSAVSQCNKTDTFNKAFGRKLALGRALLNALPGNRDVRTQLMKGYEQYIKDSGAGKKLVEPTVKLRKIKLDKK